MDELVIKYFRRLLREEFPNPRAIKKPSIFIEAVGEKLINCGNTGNYMQLFLRIESDRIAEISYMCSCAPVANVAVEVLCSLMKGLSLEEALALDEEIIYQTLGSREAELVQKVHGLLALVTDGIHDFISSQNGEPSPAQKAEDENQNISWDNAN